jgi:hypothetical protein
LVPLATGARNFERGFMAALALVASKAPPVVKGEFLCYTSSCFLCKEEEEKEKI